MMLQRYAVRRIAAAVAAGLVTLVAGDFASSVMGAQATEAEASGAPRASTEPAAAPSHSQATPSSSQSTALR